MENTLKKMAKFCSFLCYFLLDQNYTCFYFLFVVEGTNESSAPATYLSSLEPSAKSSKWTAVSAASSDSNNNKTETKGVHPPNHARRLAQILRLQSLLFPSEWRAHEEHFIKRQQPETFSSFLSQHPPTAAASARCSQWRPIKRLFNLAQNPWLRRGCLSCNLSSRVNSWLKWWRWPPFKGHI